jgi:hypothetical protein
LLHIRPYKITVVPKIKHAAYKKRVSFFNWFINYLHDELIEPKPTFFTDEASFNFSGYVNSKATGNGVIILCKMARLHTQLTKLFEHYAVCLGKQMKRIELLAKVCGFLYS